jgi:hypothetical protein
MLKGIRMKTLMGLRKIALSVVGLALLAGPVQGAEAPTATDRLTKETREAIDATQSYTAQQKEAFQRKAQAELAALQKQIAALQSRVGEASAATRADLQVSIADLEKKKEGARRKMDELRSATDAKWADVKSGMSSALEDVQAAYRKALLYLH